ncbi:MAG: hypothetical protein P4L84_16365 [Isosphaeraceae bacterium]|nr:hypothetical protein [Isosphaeraceae bacterium]
MMMGLVFVLAIYSGQFAPAAAAPGGGAALASAEPIAEERARDDLAELTQVVEEATAPGFAPAGPAIPPLPPTGATVTSPFGAQVTFAEAAEARAPFESDHAFDGFVGPMTDPIQAKDARSLTEARFVFLNNWAVPGTPVIGKGTYQVYALQLRLALTDRLQIFADKDGIVRFSPNPGKSVTGLANLAAGAKYVIVRDVENQFLFTGAVQYEPPTGYANIYQHHGSGLLGVYGIFAKQFMDDWHVSGQFGQNIAVQNQQTGYFYTQLHVDRRFGKFVPFFETSWFYYNQSAHYLPASVGMEGAGFLNLGTSGFTGNSIVTLAPGFKYDVSKHLELGVCYQFPVSDQHKSLYGNQLLAEVIFRY